MEMVFNVVTFPSYNTVELISKRGKGYSWGELGSGVADIGGGGVSFVLVERTKKCKCTESTSDMLVPFDVLL